MSAKGAAESGRLATVSAALLIGGASSRMGRDKAKIEYDGVPAATRLSRLLGGLFEEVLIVGGDPPQGAVGRRVPDVPGPQCALRGIVSALAAARAERVLVLATDLPCVTPDFLLALVAWPEADVVVPRDEFGLHPLCALYRRDPVLERARVNLAEERLRLRPLLEAVDTSEFGSAEIALVDPEGAALENVNTPDDLARLLASPDGR